MSGKRQPYILGRARVEQAEENALTLADPYWFAMAQHMVVE